MLMPKVSLQHLRSHEEKRQQPIAAGANAWPSCAAHIGIQDGWLKIAILVETVRWRDNDDNKRGHTKTNHLSPQKADLPQHQMTACSSVYSAHAGYRRHRQSIPIHYQSYYRGHIGFLYLHSRAKKKGRLLHSSMGIHHARCSLKLGVIQFFPPRVQRFHAIFRSKLPFHFGR